ncbi:hypothetical protein BOTCAL_0031g00230 [Botryotinia calthae]|uniref:Uncharacterized protein n=1 Tax=Botryotinia calthae TaxID=38488 RepID=A0A4Y8DDA0_9HELO|nr:hypothetical protein BOTCAL_0031g00230 [Botryotinia calthae]
MISHKDQSTCTIVSRVSAVSLDFEVESGVHQDVPDRLDKRKEEEKKRKVKRGKQDSKKSILSIPGGIGKY